MARCCLSLARSRFRLKKQCFCFFLPCGKTRRGFFRSAFAAFGSQNFCYSWNTFQKEFHLKKKISNIQIEFKQMFTFIVFLPTRILVSMTILMLSANSISHKSKSSSSKIFNKLTSQFRIFEDHLKVLFRLTQSICCRL